MIAFKGDYFGFYTKKGLFREKKNESEKSELQNLGERNSFAKE